MEMFSSQMRKLKLGDFPKVSSLVIYLLMSHHTTCSSNRSSVLLVLRVARMEKPLYMDEGIKSIPPLGDAFS